MKKKPKTIEELEKTVDKPEDIQPMTTEYETTTIFDIEPDYMEEPEMILHKASKMERVRNFLVSGATFDFLRHFMIGFVGIGGTAIATTGNLGWALIAGLGGGLVEGGRKVWSSSTATKNGGSKNRVLQKVFELVVALIDLWLNKRKEAGDGGADRDA